MLTTHKSTSHANCAFPRAIFLGVGFLFIFSILISLSSARIGHASTTTALPKETPTPTPTPDEVLEQAKRESQIADELKKKAVADKERAEAENAKLKAEAQPLGAANVTVPTGSVQTDAAGWVESQMLAQEAARQISGFLKNRLCDENVRIIGWPAPASPSPSPKIQSLVIYNNGDLAGVELYNTVNGQLEKLKVEITAENDRANKLLAATNPTAAPSPTQDSTKDPALAALAAPGIATGMIKSVAELINLFRTDTRFENRSVQISEDMVVSHLVNFINSDASGRCSQQIQIYYPALFPPKLTQSSETSPLVQKLTDVERLKNEAANIVERIDKRTEQLAKLGATVDDVNKKHKTETAKNEELKKKQVQKCHSKPQCQALKTEIANLRKEIEDIGKAIKDLDGALGNTPAEVANVKDNAAKNFKKWLELLAAEKVKVQALINSINLLSSKLNTPDESVKLTAMAQLLRAEKLSEILVKPLTFTLRVAVTANGTTKIKKNLFVDAKVRHSAGANLVYQLFNNDGALVQGNVMQCYIDYRSSQQVRDIVSDVKKVECSSQFRSRTGENSNDRGKK